MTGASDLERARHHGARLDERAVRVLAHPLRNRLLTQLRREGPATATQLAATLDTNSGATSYHLRKLAEVGLVEEAEEGSGRRRYWRAAHDRHSWSIADVADDPDALAAAQWLQGEQQRLYAALADSWNAQKADWPITWQDAAGAADYRLELTPDQVKELYREIDGVVERYRGVDAAPGSERVLLFLNLFPEPRRETEGQRR